MKSLIVFILNSYMAEPETSFKIYNASAGSGKTFNLVKSYLKLLLSSKSILLFRNILALTFTNKAVEEMKNRVIESLQEFSSDEILNNPNPLFEQLSSDLKMTSTELHEKSKLLLKNILHNYAAFDVSTIDKFNHRIIRTFSRDLNLPANFEVELDVDAVLKKAVDRLIDKAGSNKEVTDLLINFALEKIDDDKSWDISFDLYEIAKILIRENDREFVESVKGKSLKDFTHLKTILHKKIKEYEATIVLNAKDVLGLIYDNNLSDQDFTRSTLPNHFKKLISLNLNGLYNNQLEANLSECSSLYTKSLDPNKKEAIDTLCPSIYKSYIEIKSLVLQLLLHKNAYKNLIPLSVISEIYSSLIHLLREEQLVLISDFNNLINNEIKNQPAPYIYERLGERYKHFFIDEFQDTSVIQWKNLIPLIDNSLSQIDISGHGGSALIVGDAKQSIYRWRGGNAEQFINLYKKQDRPFTIEPQLSELEENYRSSETVVKFNNDFFKYISKKLLSSDSHIELYESSYQNIIKDDIGYVEISFIKTEENNKDDLYCSRCLEIIKSTIDREFQYQDICIITRTRKDSVILAEFLSSEKVPIISSESLLLKNSSVARFIVYVFEYLLNSTDKNIRMGILEFLFQQQLSISDEYRFYNDRLDLTPENFVTSLNELGYPFNPTALINLPLYELAESIIRTFNLDNQSNAYIQFLLDELYTYSQKIDSNMSGFIDYWHNNSDKLSIQSPRDSNAVELMTIHKAKGLEYPIVIFPYANQDIYQTKNPKAWFKVDPNLYAGFQFLYINLNKQLSELEGQGSDIYLEHQSQLEMDNLNLLYVVLTRASRELYIISEMDVNSKGQHNLNRFSGLFIEFLKFKTLWDDHQLCYSFGEKSKMDIQNRDSKSDEYIPLLSSNRNLLNLNILTRSGVLWDTNQVKAIERGKLVHDILSHIKTKSDIDKAIETFLLNGEISLEEEDQFKAMILDIINHPEVEAYYTDKWTVFNERDILSPNGESYRPDRLVIDDHKNTVIIDYKTGLPNSMHESQLQNYCNVLEKMEYHVGSLILIYINEAIQIKKL